MGITVICCSPSPHSSNLCAIFSLYKFEVCRDAEVALDRKKRAGLYMVVRPIFFIVVRAVYAPAEGCGNKYFVIKFEAGRDA